MNAESSGELPSLEDEYPPVPAAVTQVRHLVRTTLTHWEVPKPSAEDILLVVEELVANVIDHARTPFRLAVHRRDSVIRVTVHDGNPAPPEMRELAPTALRGRGLRLIAGLTERWGYDAEDSGKTVWAELTV